MPIRSSTACPYGTGATDTGRTGASGAAAAVSAAGSGRLSINQAVIDEVIARRTPAARRPTSGTRTCRRETLTTDRRVARRLPARGRSRGPWHERSGGSSHGAQFDQRPAAGRAVRQVVLERRRCSRAAGRCPETPTADRSRGRESYQLSRGAATAPLSIIRARCNCVFDVPTEMPSRPLISGCVCPSTS